MRSQAYSNTQRQTDKYTHIHINVALIHSPTFITRKIILKIF